jgi:hypothetical protein
LFWGKVLSTVNKVLNMLPSASLDHNTTPFELIEKCKPDYSILHVFGCRGYVHVNRKACKSLNSHVIPCLFLGYPADYRGWRLWDPVGKQVITARDVIWDKSTMPGNSSAPVAPLMLLDFTVTPFVEGAASDMPPLAPDLTIDTELPLVVTDDAGAPVAPNMPPCIPAVPQRPVCPLTPPERPSEPRTPSPDVKDEPSTPHPFFELRSPTPAPRTPVLTYLCLNHLALLGTAPRVG